MRRGLDGPRGRPGPPRCALSRPRGPLRCPFVAGELARQVEFPVRRVPGRGPLVPVLCAPATGEAGRLGRLETPNLQGEKGAVWAPPWTARRQSTSRRAQPRPGVGGRKEVSRGLWGRSLPGLYGGLFFPYCQRHFGPFAEGAQETRAWLPWSPELRTPPWGLSALLQERRELFGKVIQWEKMRDRVS